MLIRTTGYRLLPDGTKVEETFCNTCRHEVNYMLRDMDDLDIRYYQFEGIVEQQLFYGSTTPQKNPTY